MYKGFRGFMYGAGEGNRTLDNSLEGCGFTTKLHPHHTHGVVGTTRFEHATPWSQTRCSTKLSYVPTKMACPERFELPTF